MLSFIVNTGMWFERFVIVVTSLYREYLPSCWGTYRATKWDYMTFIGTMGLFTFLFFLFVRFLPMIPMSEIRMMLPQTKITADAEPLHEDGDLMPPQQKEFTDCWQSSTRPTELVHAAKGAYDAGYRRHGVLHAVSGGRGCGGACTFTRIACPLVCLLGGLIGL